MIQAVTFFFRDGDSLRRPEVNGKGVGDLQIGESKSHALESPGTGVQGGPKNQL